MKVTGKSFNPIRRNYKVVEVLHATNKTNEEYINELKQKNPKMEFVKIKKTKSDLLRIK